MIKAIIELNDDKQDVCLVRKQVLLDIDFYDGKMIVKEIKSLKIQNKGIPTSITILDRYFEKPIVFVKVENSNMVYKNDFINIYNFDVELDPY